MPPKKNDAPDPIGDALTPPPVPEATPSANTPPPATPPTAPAPNLNDLTASINALLGVIQQEKAERTQQTQEMQAMIQAQSETVNELRSELEAVADKGRMSDWEKKVASRDPKQKNINLQSYNGKVVVGWTPMKTNMVYKNAAGAIVENQTTELIYADQSREEVEYKAWQAGRMPVACILDSKQEMADGTTIYALSDEHGNKYSVDVKFVN